MADTSIWNRITLQIGDITRVHCDAIVNAANESLLGGGGVDGGIHRAAGPELLKECRSIGGCPTGEARITKGYQLPARYVIHTVGPVYVTGRDRAAELLRRCHESSLTLARRHDVRTIAFPAISCGVYGYPVNEAAPIAIGTAADMAQRHPEFSLITFVLFDQKVFDMFEQAYRTIKSQR